MSTPTPIRAAAIRRLIAGADPAQFAHLTWTQQRRLQALHDELAPVAKPWEDAEAARMSDPATRRLRELCYERVDASDDDLPRIDAEILAAQAEQRAAVERAQAFVASTVQAGRAE